MESSAWLREAELAQELSVSRTPVREALKRLSMEGLVTIKAHQGAMVAPITLEDTLNIYAVREALEGSRRARRPSIGPGITCSSWMRCFRR